MTIMNNEERITIRISDSMKQSIDDEMNARKHLINKSELLRSALAIGLDRMKQNRKNGKW